MSKLTIFFFLASLATSQTSSEMTISDSGQKTAEEVIANLECLRLSKWNSFFETHFPSLGVEFLRSQLSKGATSNKKYYIKVDALHNIMYFKEGSNFFIHLNQISEDGSDTLLMRAFLGDDFAHCIQILPESCKWKGQREVKYIEVCERGLVFAKDFTQDFFKLDLDESEGEMDPMLIAKTFRECYQPNCYSIAFKCYTDGLYFDPRKAKEYLEGIKKKMDENGFETRIDFETMSIKYSKTKISVNDKPIDAELDLKSLE